MKDAVYESKIQDILEGKKENLKNPYDHQVGGNHYQKKHDLAQFCVENNVPTGEFSVMKYAYRHREKGGIMDLRKAYQWLEFLAYSVYGEEL